MTRALLIAAAFLVISDAAADDRALQEERAAWFRSLKQPNSGMSCCDVSDCRRTDARPMRDGTWEAVVEGDWTPIPDEKILHDKPSIDGDAYVCAGPRGTIYCFVPPSMAM